LLAAMCGLGAIAATAQHASAGAISSNDLLVFQQGSAATPASGNVGVPINIVEVTTGGSTVQTIAISTPSLVTDSAGSEGDLSLSNGGSLLTFTGYTGGSVSNETNNAGRAVGVLDSTGAFSIPTGATYSNAATGTQTRGAYSGDGSNFYMTDKSGIYYNGGSSILTGSPNTRSIKNYGGTTYILQATAGVPVLSSLTPSSPSSGATSVTVAGVTPASGADANAVDFSLISSGQNGSTFDTLYYTDNAGIFKYALIGSTWTLEGTEITTAGGVGLGTKLSGITAVKDATAGFDLYFTNDLSTGAVLEELTDSAAYNAAPTVGSAVTLYTAPTGDLLRGVSFGPSPVPEPSGAALLLAGGLLALRRRRGLRL